MPDPISPMAIAQHQAMVMGTRGAVASSNPTMSRVGAQVLAEGGNAIDASLAMAAVGWIVLPGQCGLGGDVFAMVREPDGRVWTVGGSGYGPDGGTTDFYRSLGHSSLPLTGALSVAVPGGVAALRALHAGGATRTLDDLWQPAVALAADGYPCTAKNRRDIAEYAAELAQDPGASEVFLPQGRLPEVGELLHQRDLADFIGLVARGEEGFYTGDFADRALALLVEAGAPFSGDEWAAAADVTPQPAVAGSYAGATLYETPLPTPGWMVLQMAAICDGALGGRPQLDAGSIHWLAEAAKQAFEDRFAGCGSDTDAWRGTLDAFAVRRSRERIAGMHASTTMRGRVDGDTTSTVVVDADGRAVSFIHSLAFTYGARIMVPGTGVILNNRLGRGAYLLPGHPNEVRPRRKPLHTLNAWILDDVEHGLVHVGNCPGGDGQVQWNMQVISHLIDHGNDPQTAVSLPRFTVFPGSDADVVGQPHEVRCEEGIAAETLEQLAAWGHNVRRVPVQTGGPGGSAMVVTLDRGTGLLRAGADPRMEGVALAL